MKRIAAIVVASIFSAQVAAASSAMFPNAPPTAAQSSETIRTLTGTLLMAFDKQAMIGRADICKVVAGLPSSARNLNDLTLGIDNLTITKAILKQSLSLGLFCDPKFPLKPDEAKLGPFDTTKNLSDLRKRLQVISELNSKVKR